jgi:hypothetical protein
MMAYIAHLTSILIITRVIKICFSFLAFLQHFQVGVVSGGVSKCGDKSIPSYFTRLDHPEIANFISAPNTYFRS